MKRLKNTLSIIALLPVLAFGATVEIQDLPLKSSPVGTDQFETQEQGAGTCTRGVDCTKHSTIGDMFSNIDTPLFLIEQAAADSSVAGKGQIYVKSASPNTLHFVNDAGAEIELGALGGTVLVNDLTPQLGGTLEGNGNPISLDNTEFYQAKQSTASTVRNLLGFSTDTVQLGAATNALDVLSNGTVNIPGAAAANTILEVQAATSVSSQLLMQGFDIAHGMTDFFPTDVWFGLSPSSTTGGGAVFTGLTDVSNGFPLLYRAYHGNVSPTTPSVLFLPGKTNGGTGRAALAATEIGFRVSNFDNSVHALTIFGSGAQLKTTTATTQDADVITANSLTTGNMVLGTHANSADGLTARTAGNNFIDYTTSRTETRTSGTTADDYDLMSLSRTSITTGGGGTLTSAGSVLKLENVVTQTAGTLTDSAEVLELVQDVDSTGSVLSMNLLTSDNGFVNFKATCDGDATSACSTLTTVGAATHQLQFTLNDGTTIWIAATTTDPS